jgi:hypothetical protein
MEHSNSQFTLFCLALMLATLGYALYRINSAKRHGETAPEASASWAILSAFVVCGLAFMQVALDGAKKQVDPVAHEADAVHHVEQVVELGKPQ